MTANTNTKALRLASATFLYFTKEKPLKNYGKCFLFHLKYYFCNNVPKKRLGLETK